MNVKKISLVAGLFTLAGLSAVSIHAQAKTEIKLMGTVTKTTCSLDVNGGKSILDIGTFQTAAFTQPNKMLGSVPLPVSLRACGKEDKGELVIQGETSSRSPNQNIFVNDQLDTVGFMITEEDGTTMVSSGKGPTVNIPNGADAINYTFKVGMAAAVIPAVEGAYSVPIVVSYVVN